jgi:hypothetical protein
MLGRAGNTGLGGAQGFAQSLRAKLQSLNQKELHEIRLLQFV